MVEHFEKYFMIILSQLVLAQQYSTEKSRKTNILAVQNFRIRYIVRINRDYKTTKAKDWCFLFYQITHAVQQLLINVSQETFLIPF